MTWAQQGTTKTNFVNNGLTLSVTLDAGPSSGDLIIITGTSNKSADAYNTPTGYTAGTYASSTTNPIDCKQFYKVSDGTEGTTVTLTKTANARFCVSVSVYRASNGSPTFDQQATNQDAGSTVTSLASGTTATLNSNNKLAIASVGVNSLAVTQSGWGTSDGNYANLGSAVTSLASAITSVNQCARLNFTGTTGEQCNALTWTGTGAAAASILVFDEPAGGGGHGAYNLSALGVG